jgi:broad specificity phosphatase PhoE
MLKPNTSLSLVHLPLKFSVTWNYDIPDPLLTALGETQSRSIPQKYPFLFEAPLPLLVSSPFRRTLQTSLIGFNRNPHPHPGFQENSSKPCDTGSPPSVLREEFPELDFELVVDGWDSKTGEWGADEVSLARRAAKMRKWLKDREEDEIVVVTHGGKDPGGDVLMKVSCCTLLRRLEDLRILK